MCFKKIDADFADSVVKQCCDAYNKLPKTGKPTDAEWTVVAAIVEENGGVTRVVSLGTGSKCLGRNALSRTGDLLHDAHAEVVARRGLLLYLYCEILSLCRTGVSLVLDRKEENIKLKENIRYIFVSSTVPCGDAAIIPMESGNEAVGIDETNECEDGISPVKKARLLPNDCEGVQLNAGIVDDVHRTGAKCLPGQEQDPKLPGSWYHVVGAVRTKPGRGDPTASVSCSDKLARWNAVGLQGALLSLILPHPVSMAAIIIGGGGPYSTDSNERAVNTRIGCPTKVPILQSRLPFPHIRSKERSRPAPSSIAWNVATNKVQVCVEGRKLGATKSKPGQAALDISKIKLMQRFVEIAKEANVKVDGLESVSYRDLKNRATRYREAWKDVISTHLRSWTEKPAGLEDFTIPQPL